MTGRTRRHPAAYLLGVDGPGVETPGWACDWLMRHTDLMRQAVNHRGENPAVDEWLVAVRETAYRWRGSEAGSGPGTPLASTPEPATESDMADLLGVSAVARDIVGISDSAVRRACRQNRIPAVFRGGQWLITREAAEQYRADRAA